LLAAPTSLVLEKAWQAVICVSLPENQVFPVIMQLGAAHR
jgi:hypothetical protein